MGIFLTGYVLDGFPSLCEDYMSVKDQLELVKNWKLQPDFIINLRVSKSLYYFQGGKPTEKNFHRQAANISCLRLKPGHKLKYM